MNAVNEEQESMAEESGGVDQIRQKHKNPILFELYWSNPILHVTLANRVLLSASGLNASLKKLNEGDVKPVQEEKSGKFKFYYLTAEGKQYVRDEILSALIDSGQEEEIHNIFNLLVAYKDKKQGSWNKGLADILEEESGDVEEQDLDAALGQEFIKKYVHFYREDAEKAEALLKLLVVDKQLQQKIIAYSESQTTEREMSVIETINQWIGDDCEEAYRVLDCLIENLTSEEERLDLPETALRGAEERLEGVRDKMFADMFCALAGGWEKQRLSRTWIQDGMEIQLALYLAEKYSILRSQILRNGRME